MRIVKTSLSSAQIDDLEQAPGETDSDRLRWLVGFWGKTLEANRARLADEKNRAERPAQLALVRATADEVVEEMRPGTEVETAEARMVVGVLKDGRLS